MASIFEKFSKPVFYKMSTILVLLLGLSLAYGNDSHPNEDTEARRERSAVTAPLQRDAVTGDRRSFITVPENCPNGQRLINAVCRDVWTWETPATRRERSAVTAPMQRDADSGDRRSFITVPENCPNGQRLINAVCRDVWTWETPATMRGRSAVTAPMQRDDATENKELSRPVRTAEGDEVNRNAESL